MNRKTALSFSVSILSLFLISIMLSPVGAQTPKSNPSAAPGSDLSNPTSLTMSGVFVNFTYNPSTESITDFAINENNEPVTIFDSLTLKGLDGAPLGSLGAQAILFNDQTAVVSDGRYVMVGNTSSLVIHDTPQGTIQAQSVNPTQMTMKMPEGLTEIELTSPSPDVQAVMITGENYSALLAVMNGTVTSHKTSTGSIDSIDISMKAHSVVLLRVFAVDSYDTTEMQTLMEGWMAGRIGNEISFIEDNDGSLLWHADNFGNLNFYVKTHSSEMTTAYLLPKHTQSNSSSNQQASPPGFILMVNVGKDVFAGNDISNATVSVNDEQLTYATSLADVFNGSSNGYYVLEGMNSAKLIISYPTSADEYNITIQGQSANSFAS